MDFESYRLIVWEVIDYSSWKRGIGAENSIFFQMGFENVNSFFVFSHTEMVESMKNVARLNVDLTVEERNLLSVGYKNVIGSRRASWRIFSSIEQKEAVKGNDANVKRIKEYMDKVEIELSNICIDIMSVLDEHLIPSASEGESTVFFNKM